MRDLPKTDYKQLLRSFHFEQLRLTFQQSAGGAVEYSAMNTLLTGARAFQLCIAQPETGRFHHANVHSIRVGHDEPEAVKQLPHSQLVVLSFPPIYCPIGTAITVLASLTPELHAKEWDLIVLLGKKKDE